MLNTSARAAAGGLSRAECWGLASKGLRGAPRLETQNQLPAGLQLKPRQKGLSASSPLTPPRLHGAGAPRSKPPFPRGVLPPKGGCREGRRSQPPTAGELHAPRQKQPLWLVWFFLSTFILVMYYPDYEKKQELKSSFPFVSQYTEPCPASLGDCPGSPAPRPRAGGQPNSVVATWWLLQKALPSCGSPLPQRALPPAQTLPAPHSTPQLCGALGAGEGPTPPPFPPREEKKKNKYRGKKYKKVYCKLLQ